MSHEPDSRVPPELADEVGAGVDRSAPDDGPIDFPDVYEAELDPTTLARLFHDLHEHARVIEVRAKDRARGHARDGSLSLDEARFLLESRSVHGIQVRYRHEGELWMDTLLAGQQRVRLVRMRVPERGVPRPAEPPAE